MDFNFNSKAIGLMNFPTYIKFINTKVNTATLEYLIETALPLIDKNFNAYISFIVELTNKLQSLFMSNDTKDEISKILDDLNIILAEIQTKDFIDSKTINENRKKFTEELMLKARKIIEARYITKRPIRKEESRILLVFSNIDSKINNCYRDIIESHRKNFIEYIKLAVEVNNAYTRLYTTFIEEQNCKLSESIVPLQDKLNSSRNLFDYKELNKLAEEFGYSYDRQKGSHAQFKNKTTGKLITIPQGRDIGKGLSCKIQKDIQIEKLNIF